MQSYDYKPGVSGWKLEKGVLYLNSATIQVGALPAAPQLVTVQASSWPESSLPIGALEQVKFIQGEIEAIPEQWRESAELSTSDESYGEDGSEIRTTLTYKRPETAAETEARIAAFTRAGKRIKIRGGGWELYDEHGVLRARLGPALDDEPQGRAQADEASAATMESYSVRVAANEAGRYFCAGFGIGIRSSELRSDILIKAEHVEILPDGMVRIKQSAFNCSR